MKLPKTHNKEAIQKVLDGAIGYLGSVFDWDDTEQGSEYWIDIFKKKRLTDDARRYLRRIITPCLKDLLEEDK